MAMFSVLVSTNPTAATVCGYGDSGGGEGGDETSCLGWERTTDVRPKASAASAIRGRMNFLIVVLKGSEGRVLSLVGSGAGTRTCLARFGFHNAPVIHVCDGVRVMENTGVVGNHDDGAIRMDGIPGKQLHH